MKTIHAPAILVAPRIEAARKLRATEVRAAIVAGLRATWSYIQVDMPEDLSADDVRDAAGDYFSSSYMCNGDLRRDRRVKLSKEQILAAWDVLSFDEQEVLLAEAFPKGRY